MQPNILSFLPVSVRRALSGERPLQSSARGAALFADIAGFTKMTEALADADDGAEITNRILLRLFTGLIDPIEQRGGIIAHFYGDAMLVYFLDGEPHACRRALECAEALQAVMAAQRQALPHAAQPVPLELKIGVGYGDCFELIVGDDRLGREFVFGGAAVERATAAEQRARPGETVVDPSVTAILGDGVGQQPPWVGKEVEVGNDLAAGAAAIAATFMAPALYERLQLNRPIAEHRPVTSIFLSFELAADDDGSQLDDYYRWACRIVQAYAPRNGRVNRLLTGDKGNQLHIILGAPLAPHAPAQALRLALALQRRRPDYVRQQCIGVVTGRVFAGPVGSRSRREYTVIGSVVNLSARLCAICNAGEVLTDAATVARAGNAVVARPLAAIALKGLQQLVAPVVVEQERVTPAQLGARFGSYFDQPLIAREQQWQTLWRRLQQALQGEPAVIALEGRAGVGKSRLAAAAAAGWLAEAGHGYVGACTQQTSDQPYAPWISILRALAGLDTASALTPVEQITGLLQHHGLPQQPELYMLLDVLGMTVTLPPELAAQSSRQRQQRLHEYIVVLLHAYTANQPHLFIIEDLHWADRASLDLLQHLAGALRNAPVAIVTTVRAGRRDLLPAQAQTIVVPELRPDGARAYLAHLLQVPLPQLPAALVDYLRLTPGSGMRRLSTPLLLEETVRAMWAERALQRTEGLTFADSKRIAQLSLPEDAHGLLLARLDRLPPAARQLIEIASVIGDQFSEPLLSAVSGRSEQEVAQALALLHREDLIRQIGSEPQTICLFRHALLRDAAYATLPTVRRKRLHLAIAAALEAAHAPNLAAIAAALARHYSVAQRHEPALHYARQAAYDAYALNAIGEALALFGVALAHVEHVPNLAAAEVVDLYLRHAQLSVINNDLETAQREAQKGLEVAEQHLLSDQILRATVSLAQIANHRAAYQEAQRYAEEAIRQARRPTNGANGDEQDEMLIMALIHYARAAARQGDFNAARERLEEAEQQALAIGNDRRLALALELLAYLHYSRSRLHEAHLVMQRGLTVARRISPPQELISYLNNLALLQRLLCEFRPALTTIEEAHQLASGLSLPISASLRRLRGSVRICLGDYAAAHADFRQALQQLLPESDRNELFELYLTVGYEYHCTLEQWAEAQRSLASAQALIEGDAQFEGERFRLALAQLHVHLATGEQQAALVVAQQLESSANAAFARRWRASTAYYIGRVERLQGRIEAAAASYRKALRIIEHSGLRIHLALLLLELGEISNDADERQAYFVRCREAAERWGSHADRVLCERRMQLV